MGTVRKIGDEYFIEFYARGLKYQQKAGVDRTAAEKALKEIEAKLAQGEAATIVRDVDHDLFFLDYRESIQDQHTPKTIQRYVSTIAHFSRYLQSEQPQIKKLSEITPKIIEQYKFFLLKERSYKENLQRPADPQKINLTLLLMTDLFQYAIKLGYLNDNPALHIRLVPSQEMQDFSLLTEEEIQLLLKSLSLDWRMITEFLLLTGLRLEELLTLHWKDCDWPNQCLRIPHASSGLIALNVRTIPFHPRVIAILQDLKIKKHDPAFIFGWLRSHKDSLKDYWKMLQSVFKGSNSAKKINWRTIRHTFAINLIRKGVRFSALYKFLGENDIARMMIYVKYLPDQI